jgi:FlaA1/EpsC-like NDP-sugar epimerase
MSVRFGNVLASRGSVPGTFARQVDAGGPVTVTDPGATRYFRTIPEAVERVVQAGATGSAGEVPVPSLGAPVTNATVGGPAPRDGSVR